MSRLFPTMRGLTTVCPSGLVLTYLVLFSFISLTTAVTFDLTDFRNKVAKIKVNPRGNLWATGHFMGKKSVMDNPLLPSSDDDADGNEEEEEDDVSRENYLLGNLFQEVLRVGLKAQPDSRSKSQETGLLMKILQNYVQSSRM